MAFDLNKLKGMLPHHKSAQGELAGSNLGKYAKWEEFKAGLYNIKHVLEERKLSLFVKQVAVLAVVFLAVRSISGKLAAHQAELKDKINALTIQSTNKEDYLNNKDHLLRLEPLFPNKEQKSDWLPSMLMALFRKHDLSPQLDGNFAESAQKGYVVVSKPIAWQQSYKNLGEMLANMENSDTFLRVSEISISKLTGKEVLGENSVTVKFNTIFPNEKYAPKLFKDYAQQMKKINAQKEEAAAETKTEVRK